MKKSNTWNIIGMILGIAIIILGIVFMNSPAKYYKTNSAEDASFGADYYTYQYEATKIVAGNTSVTANNLRELSLKMAEYQGALFIVIGCLVFLHYGKECFTKTDNPMTHCENPTCKNEQYNNPCEPHNEE